MKKIIFVIMMVITMATLVGCNNSDESEKPRTLWMKPEGISKEEIELAKQRRKEELDKKYGTVSKEYMEELEYNSRTNDWSK